MATHPSILAWKIPRTEEATVHRVAKSWVLSLHDSQQGALQPSTPGLLCLLVGRLGFTVALAEWDPRGQLALLTIPAPTGLSLAFPISELPLPSILDKLLPGFMRKTRHVPLELEGL